MMTALYLAAGLALVIWFFLIVGRSGFWRAQPRLSSAQSPLEDAPSILAIIPARNEVETIAATVKSICAQDYPGDLKILLVDDQSTDGTAAAAKGAGLFDLRVIQTPPLPVGWSGKTWALEAAWQDLLQRDDQPDYVWLNDADIVHAPHVLNALVAQARASQSALTSLMVRLEIRGLFSKFLIPAFIYFFQLLYPFPAINRAQSRTAGAAGGCILLERQALARIGGFRSLKDALIDDCTLALRVQEAGGGLWLGHGLDSTSLRSNMHLSTIWTMVKRTAYAQLFYNPFLLVGCLLGLVLVFIVPPVALAVGLYLKDVILMACGSLAWLCMALSYVPTLKLYDRWALEALALPLVTLLYGFMTIDSAVSQIFGRGNAWKGRTYGKEHRDA